MKRLPKQVYTAEFQAEAVRLVLEEGLSLAKAARRISVPKGFGRAATGVAFSFATTCALGQIAKRYYAGGRQMGTAVLQDTYWNLLGPAKQLQAAIPAADRTEGDHDRRNSDHRDRWAS